MRWGGSRDWAGYREGQVPLDGRTRGVDRRLVTAQRFEAREGDQAREGRKEECARRRAWPSWDVVTLARWCVAMARMPHVQTVQYVEWLWPGILVPAPSG